MINLPLTSIDKAAIESLITSEIRESRTLDYKETLPSNGKDHRKEFLADVSAFANAAGGDIVYGIRERRDDNKPTGIPECVVGLPGINADNVILQLDSVIRDGLEPRVTVQIHVVQGFDEGPVIVMRIPKSWAAPHMLKTGDSRFYSRTNAGKYGMDVSQIRSAFTLSDTISERVRRFRDERLGRIVAGEMPVQLPAYSKTVLHLVPIAALDPATQVDFSTIKFSPGLLHPMNAGSASPRYNLDGFLSPHMSLSENNVATSYIQIFRNGAIEAVESEMLEHNNNYARHNGGKISNKFASMPLEQDLIKCLKQFLEIEATLRFEPPFFVMLTFVGIRNYLLIADAIPYDNHYRFDRDTLILPDVMIERYDEKPDQILQPVFDALWQASGLDRCRHYKDGRWLDSSGRPAV